jgi:hypothetical protein
MAATAGLRILREGGVLAGEDLGGARNVLSGAALRLSCPVC